MAAVRGRRRVPVTSILCWSLVAPAAVWAVVRTFGLERGPLVQLLAFTPYAAVAALVPLAVALLARRWWAAGAAGLALLLLAVAVVPRAIPTDRVGDGADGPAVRVLTANLLVGRSEPAALVSLVREHRVDVLALQELSAAARAALHREGLSDLLPYDRSSPVGVAGSAVYSRFPLRDGGVRHNPGGFRQAYATIEAPGAAPVVVESVHPRPPPYGAGQLSTWWADQADQPTATPDGPVRILAGDFNATLDHVAMRRLIDTGYRDAADAVGAGLLATWGPYLDKRLPPVTLDRVLVDTRVGVRDLSVHPLPGSDHRAVLAELVLPRKPG